MIRPSLLIVLAAASPALAWAADEAKESRASATEAPSGSGVMDWTDANPAPLDAIDVGRGDAGDARTDPGAEARQHTWTVEAALSGYRPRIDEEFDGSASPYATAFGKGRGLMARLDVSRVVLRYHGALEVGLGAGYFERYGKGLLEDGTRSADSTALKILPTRLTLTYRLELLQEVGVPLVPYGRLALDRYWWWVDNGSGGTASSGTRTGRGATNGYSAAIGLALVLDFLDPVIRRDMRRDSGMVHVALFAEASRSFVKDFGSSRSWDLSNDRITFSGGLALMF